MSPGYVVGGPVLSVVLPVGLAGGITLQHRVASVGHGLRLSPYGVEFLRRDGRIVRLRWADIRAVTLLTQKRTGVIAPTAAVRTIASGDSAAFAAANSGAGLIGLGDVLTHEQVVQQRVQGQGWLRFADPVQVTIRLVVVDRQWQTGRIGEWFRRYRPDLVP